MAAMYTVTGHMVDAHTVSLNEDLPLEDQNVRVTVEAVGPSQQAGMFEVLDSIHAEQRRRGHVPPTREEVDRYLAEERASWDME